MKKTKLAVFTVILMASMTFAQSNNLNQQKINEQLDQVERLSMTVNSYLVGVNPDNNQIYIRLILDNGTIKYRFFNSDWYSMKKFETMYDMLKRGYHLYWTDSDGLCDYGYAN